MQVWSLIQFYSIDFSQSRISVEKCVSNQRTIKVCICFFCPCPGTSAPSAHNWQCPCFFGVLEATHEWRALEGRLVSSKSHATVWDGDGGLAGRNGREKCFRDERGHWFALQVNEWFCTKRKQKKIVWSRPFVCAQFFFALWYGVYVSLKVREQCKKGALEGRFVKSKSFSRVLAREEWKWTTISSFSPSGTLIFLPKENIIAMREWTGMTLVSNHKNPGLTYLLILSTLTLCICLWSERSRGTDFWPLFRRPSVQHSFCCPHGCRHSGRSNNLHNFRPFHPKVSHGAILVPNHFVIYTR